MAKARSSIRVLIADDHTIFREGLRKLLEAEDDITVVGEARTGIECVELWQKVKPDVIVLDLRMPEKDGLEVLSELAGPNASAKVVVLTASEDERDFVEAVRRGARGIILKQAPSELLVEGIRKVQRGEVWIDQRVTAGVMKAMAEGPGSLSGRDKPLLSDREREVVQLVAQGLRNKEIAEKLFISEQTVKNHLHNIFDKLGVSDRLELALYALHHHLIRTE
ncbi:MAG: response regulator transcription factor [Acidobacteria bacterium]|nr:response regulator transcription factor [Acidobacteriota bacterium]